MDHASAGDPARPTYEFVGRHAELASTTALVRDETLVMLAGPGGSGKTRLAAEVVRRLAADGTVTAGVVELAPLPVDADLEAVAAATVATLSLRPRHGETSTAVVLRGCVELDGLLVLDNCEHVRPAVAAMLELIREQCPNLHVLATSRSPLRVDGERIVTLGSLPVDDGVRLFVERAAAVEPSLPLESAHADIATLCTLLDGSPLAIEFAAARARLLSPAETLARLDDRFGLLRTRSGTVPDRQQTLLATLDWSHDLLTGPEQVLLRRLAVFRGGAPVEGVEAVCAGPPLPAGIVLDSLQALVDGSLVVTERHDERTRIVLNETTRAYADAKLDASGERPDAERRQREWVLALVRDAAPRLKTGAQQESLDLLQSDLDNIRSALSSARARDDGETTVEIATGMLRYWIVRGSWSEARSWLQAAATLTQPDHPDQLRVLDGLAVLSDLLSDYAESTRLWSAHLELARRLGDRKAVADALGGLALATGRRGDEAASRRLLVEQADALKGLDDPRSQAKAVAALAASERNVERAQPLRTKALQLYRGLGDTELVIRQLIELGWLQVLAGDRASARRTFDESHRVAADLGYTRYAARSVMCLAEAALAELDLPDAARLLAEANALWRDVGHRNALAEAHLLEAEIDHENGRFEDARRLADAAAGAFAELGMEAGLAAALRCQAELARVEGAPTPEATRLARQALATAVASQADVVVADCLDTLAALAADSAECTTSASLLGSATAVRASVGLAESPRHSAARELVAQRCRDVIGSPAYDAAVAVGRATPLSDVLVAQGLPPAAAGSIDPAVGKPPAATQAILRPDGDLVTVAYGGSLARVRANKGMRQLHLLVRSPGVEMHALQLLAPDRETIVESDTGPLLDETAKRALRNRVDDLREEVREAEEFGDGDRAARAREALDAIAQELARALGLGGRSRVAGSAAERARLNVTRSLRAAISRISTVDAALGRHLENRVRTGTYCCYEPDDDHPVEWVT